MAPKKKGGRGRGGKGGNKDDSSDEEFSKQKNTGVSSSSLKSVSDRKSEEVTPLSSKPGRKPVLPSSSSEEEEEATSSSSSSSSEDERPVGGARGRKGQQSRFAFVASSSSSPSSEESSDEEATSSEGEGEKEEDSHRKKSKKRKDEPSSPSSDSDEESEEDEKEKIKNKKKKGAALSQKGGKKKGFQALSSSEEEDEDEDGSEKEEEEEKKKKKKPDVAVPSKSQGMKGGKKKAKGKQGAVDEADDLDAILQEVGGGASSSSNRQQKQESKVSEKPSPENRNKKGAKKGKSKEDDEDLDALLAELDGKKTSAPPEKDGDSEKKKKLDVSAGSPQAEGKPAGAGGEEEEEPPQGTGGSTTAGAGGLTKNQLKKQKKKAAAAQKKEAQKKKEDDSDDETTTTKAGGAAAAKKGPLTAAARAAQERMRLIKEEEERQRREEEERKRQEEEERKREEEEERRRLEEKAAREQRRAERKQRLKEEGKLLSSKEKKERERQKAFLQQLQQQGIIIGEPAEGEDATGGGEKKKKGSRLVDDKKKKKREKSEKRELSEKQSDDTAGEKSPQQNEDEEEQKRKEKEEEEKKRMEEKARDNWEELLEELDDGDDASSASPQGQGREKSEGGENKNVSPQSQQKIRKGPLNARQRAAMEAAAEKEKEEKERKAKQKEEEARAQAALESENRRKKKDVELRSPIVCILGHVDTGKTKLLDKIRHTNVQDNEAGGITQQIGATFFPPEALVDQCKKFGREDLRLPGLLIIDTPGHSSFTNLRARGSSLCDLAIVVVDIMHGMEQQTRESLELLKQKKCPFIIALNKIDRLYGWKTVPWQHDIPRHLQDQGSGTRDEFERRATEAITQLQEEGFNCRLYWENEDVRKNVSVVPTSAVTGEGIPDLLNLVVQVNESLMQKTIAKEAVDRRVARGERQLQCTILEVKAIDGLGTTIDVILVHGTLYEGDKIVVCGMSGPIVTTIRALLTPQPLKELRVKGEYIQHAFIEAAMGIKIAAPNLEEAVAGTSLFVVEDDEEIEDLKEEVMSDMSSIFKSVDRSGSGVYVMASTLGSLEALLVFLKESNIPVFGVNIGTVQKKDVKKASIMREKGRPDLSVILAFNVKVDAEAEKEAKSLGVKIMTAEIIYHLFDEFTAYFQSMKEEKKKEVASEAIFPCILGVLPQYIFNKKDPLILGVVVEEGVLKVGTPLCVPEKGDLRIGRVASLELNKKPCEKATKGQEVCVKISGEPNVMIGRHFEAKNKIVSRLTRDSIDCLKEHFRDEMSKDDWRTVITLKKILGIQ